jgi:branched-chain amino acid transport system substrate-binding protein
LNPNAVLVGESFVKITETDYSPYIAKLKGAKPDIAFTAWAAASSFVKQAKPAGVFDEIQVVNPAWVLGELVSWPKEDVPKGAILGGTPWYAINNPENAAFVDIIKNLFKLAPTDCEYFTYISTMFGLEAIKKAGTADKEKIVSVLEGLTLNTPVGKVTLRDFDHQSTYPFFLGRAAWSDQYGYGILENVERFSVEDALPTKAAVEAARKKGQ